MASFAHGTCGCFDDPLTCVITYFAPCYIAGKNAEAVGENCLLYGCLGICGPIGIYTRSTIRQKIREKYSIGDKEGNLTGAGGLVGDLLCHCGCGLCSLVQESQELKGHGDKAADGIKAEPINVNITRT